ncbi:MFS transporter [Sphingobium boeckii]|uniref:GPH family glycoside/pentoside/hexuronide:cation symporter n=1 Tax=Sphingobium boeckii TaxID=1082345 RepID=A0A7W9AL82_9SPHN|nr:MFS transporter [Sphingobium boeckii]MBB5687728.1 GPH family glycoside/pentoside/hexuronide:cation symporter [Sphingobium boeckii]
MTKAAHLPTSVMLRYGIGQTGAQVFRDTPAALIPLFMTTMLGVPAWIAGLAVLLPKLWVIICDPLMGSLSDRWNARIGRAPFLLIGAILTSVSFTLLFWFSEFSSPMIGAAAVCLLFLLASTAFSAYSVPYLAIASELSPDPHERTKILAYRMIFTIVGVLIGVGLAQPVIFHFGGGAHGWRIMALGFGLICLLTMLVPALSLGKPSIGVAVEAPGIAAQLRMAWRAKPYVTITSVNFLLSVAQAVSYTVIGFVFIYAIGNVNMILPFVVTMSLGSMISQPIWLLLSRKYGKTPCFIGATVAWCLLTLTWLMVHPGGPVLVHLPLWGALSVQEAGVLLRGFIIGLTNAGFILLILSMMTDTIDQERRLTGQANEGVFSGIFSATEKLSFAIGPLIAGFVLSTAGFQSSTHGVIAQSQGAVTGILLLYSVIPAGIAMLAVIVFTRYPAILRRREEMV